MLQQGLMLQRWEVGEGMWHPYSSNFRKNERVLPLLVAEDVNLPKSYDIDRKTR